MFPNITPDPQTGIGALSDGQLARFLRTGINHRGEYGLPFMDYRTISPADLLAIVSFLRAQPPVVHDVPASRYNFLGKLTLRWFLVPGLPGRFTRMRSSSSRASRAAATSPRHWPRAVIATPGGA